MSGILRVSLFYKKLKTAVKICDIKHEMEVCL